MPERAAAPARQARTPGTAPVPPRGRARARRLWRGVSREIAARWDLLAVIAAGGAAGSLARWSLAAAVPHPAGAFPWATFGTNVTGCLLIGALIVLAAEVWPPSRYLRPFLGTGVLGGYTTFSTFMLETRGLLVSGHPVTAGAYLAGSLTAGLAAVWAGVVAVRFAIRLARWRRRRKAGTGGPGRGRPAPTAVSGRRPPWSP